MDAASVGAIDGDKDGIHVGLILIDGVLDGPGDGYGDPVSTVGPGLGCPVSVGELDGTKDTLGWLDGEFQTLGAELGKSSNPLSLAPSPSLSNRLDPSPPILEFIGSFCWYQQTVPLDPSRRIQRSQHTDTPDQDHNRWCWCM